MPKLLVVDDEALICDTFRWVFGTGEVEVVTAGTVAEGRRRAQDDRPDVIVLDLQLPDGTGIDLFDCIRAADPKRPVLFITAPGTTDTASMRTPTTRRRCDGDPTHERTKQGRKHAKFSPHTLA